MNCPYQEICGGCPLRGIAPEQYREQKKQHFEYLMHQINQENISFGLPVFIGDGNRRRSEFSFSYGKNKLIFGFNAAQTHVIADIENCVLLTDQINTVLPMLRSFLKELCNIKFSTPINMKKPAEEKNIKQGKILLTQAENGIDILLKISEQINLRHRMIISEFMANCPSIIRFSVQAGNNSVETVLEKMRPYINIAGYRIYIPSGTFLQASEKSEKAMTELVVKYLADTQGNIADLFCGVGTFSYPLAKNIKNKITAADSSAELLEGFKQSVNTQTIPNIRIINRNLFKYPFDSSELKGYSAVVFDPPRAGAAAQTKEIAKMKNDEKPQKVIAISCNPHTFINDADTLISGGYKITEITMVDQFTFSTHCELVALFEL